MEKVCKKHQETPAIMYGECIGCELEKVRAREREACALLVETGNIHKAIIPHEWLGNVDPDDVEAMTRLYAAAAIRARGEINK